MAALIFAGDTLPANRRVYSSGWNTGGLTQLLHPKDMCYHGRACAANALHHGYVD